jgi:hypothetical protein
MPAIICKHLRRFIKYREDIFHRTDEKERVIEKREASHREKCLAVTQERFMHAVRETSCRP